MQTSFTLSADELSMDFLTGLKTMFLGKRIELTVSDENDETEYLLKSEANKTHLLSSIAEIEASRVKTINSDSL